MPLKNPDGIGSEMNGESTKRYVTLFAMSLLAGLLLGGYFVVRSPVAFQKSISIQPIDVDEPTLETKGGSSVDIRALVESIPYKKPQMVYEVEPQQKYRKTIVEGYGNCSNLSFGLGYYLSQMDHQYQIVHLLPPSRFLDGEGHTVVHTSYELDGKVHLGIVDVLEGGLPKSGGTLIGLRDLRQGNLDNVSILTLNSRHDSLSPFYGELLDTSVIGVTTSEEVEEYFDFLESVYRPIGNARIEKYIYDGISLFLGKYPNTYVGINDYDTLFKDNKDTRFLSICFLWFSRLFSQFGVLLITLLAYTRCRNA